MIDEKGRLFGKLNIVDLLVILVVLVAVVVLGVKFLGKDGGGGINPGKTQVTYTVLVKGVEQEVYDNIQKYIPGQLMASGEMLDGQVVSVEPRAHEQTVTVDTTDGTLEIPVDEGTIDLLFTIECNVVNPITTEIGTQEVRVGKTHTVKTDKFELMNGVILDCEWGRRGCGRCSVRQKNTEGRRQPCRRPSPIWRKQYARMVSESGRRHPALAPGGGAQRRPDTPVYALHPSG